MKQYGKALRIVQYVSQKCTKEKKVLCGENFENHFNDIGMCFTRYTIRQWFRLYYSCNITVNEHDILNEYILQLFSKANLHYPSLVFAVYMACLCAYRCGFSELCREYIKALHSMIECKAYITDRLPYILISYCAFMTVCMIFEEWELFQEFQGNFDILKHRLFNSLDSNTQMHLNNEINNMKTQLLR